MSLTAGVDTSFGEFIVQLSGAALKMSASDFRVEIEINAPFPAFTSTSTHYP